MSRSHYYEDDDGDREALWSMIRWRGAVKSAIRGARGQAFLKEMLDALDALPEKKLIAHDLVADGYYCALGAVGRKRGLDMDGLNPENHEQLAQTFGVAPALVREIEFMNDDDFACFSNGDPEARWRDMRAWVVENLEVNPS